MLIKKNFISFIIFSLIFSNSFALDTKKLDSKKIYNNFILRIEKKYSLEDEIKKLEKVQKLFISIKNKTKRDFVKKLVGDLIILNAKKIFLLKKNYKEKNKEKLEKNYSKNNKIIENKCSENICFQEKIENEEVKKLKNIQKSEIDSKIKYLNNLGFEVIFTNFDMEFVKDSKIWRIFFEKYYKINDKNYKLLSKKNKNSKIIINNDEIFFVEDYKIEQKIPYSKLEKYGFKLIKKNKKYFLENDIYYTILFDKFLFNGDKYGFYRSILEKNGLDLSKIFFYFDGQKFGIVKKYKKVKLVSSYIVDGITNKNIFLNNLAGDVKIENKDYDKELLEIKKFTLNLTKDFNKEEKIKKIYSYLIDNLTYFTGNYNKNKKVFSGLESFKTKIGICEAYVKLFLYMSSFAGIDNVDIIKGYVFTSKDFPNIGHAWIKIEDKYYDPTFDDPIGNSGNIKQENYLYFGLNKDLFYTNRFDFENKKIFEELKNKSFEQRELIAEKNLYKFIKKYPNSNLVKTILYKQKLGFLPGEKITIEKLKNKLKFLKVDKKFNFIDKNGKKRYMLSIKFFDINDKNAGILLKQEKENFLNAYLLQKKDKYYLAVNFKFK